MLISGNCHEIVNKVIEDRWIVINWSECYNALDLPSCHMVQYDTQFKAGILTPYMLFHNILTLWISRNGVSATLDNFCSVLRKNKFNIAADALQNINEQPSTKKISFQIESCTQWFTGRADFIEKLHKTIQRNTGVHQNNSVTVLSQTTAISGLGGVGKTETARRYVEKYSFYYDNILWINAANYAAIEESFKLLAGDNLEIPLNLPSGKEKSISRIVEETYDFLSASKSLFIFDNAEKYKNIKKSNEFGISNFLPKCKPNVYILITSRNQDWPQTMETIQLDTWSPDEARTFIIRRLELDTENLSASELDEINELGNILQYLPIALEQAATYIYKTKIENQRTEDHAQVYGIKNFLEEYKCQAKATKLLDYPFFESYHSSNSYEETTYNTLLLTTTKLQQLYGENVIEVLQLLSYLNPEDIPILLIDRFFPDQFDLVRESINNLAQYSLINASNGIIRIHRVVQNVVQINAGKQHKDIQLLTTFSNVVMQCLTQPNNRGFVPHVLSIVRNCLQYENVMQVDDIIKLVNEYRTAGEYANLIHFYASCEDTVKTSPIANADEYFIGNFMFALSKCYLENSMYDKAMALTDETYQLRKSQHGEMNEDTMEAKLQIAKICQLQGKHEEAKQLLEGMKANELTFYDNNSHPVVVNALGMLASTLLEMGERKKAFSLIEGSYEAIKAECGPNHERTAIAAADLSYGLVYLGRVKEALKYDEEVLQYRLRHEKPDWPAVLRCKSNYAIDLYYDGQYDRAIELWKEVLTVYEGRQAAESNGDVLRARNNMALCLRKLDRIDEALKIHQDVLKIRRQSLGETHYVTLVTKRVIGVAFRRKGDYETALACFNAVHKELKEKFSENHPHLYETQHNIGICLAMQGKLEESMQLLQEVLAKRKSALGPDHPDTLSSMHYIAYVLEQQKKTSEAKELYKHVWNKRKEVIGEDHPNTKTTLKRLLGLEKDSNKETNK